MSFGEAHEQGIGVLHGIKSGVVVSSTSSSRTTDGVGNTTRRQYLCGVEEQAIWRMLVLR